MSDRDAVLFANEAFYLCFAAGDTEGMAALWAEEAPVSCIHPGWEPLNGRQVVIDSWRSIMNAGAPSIRCREAVASLYGDTAMVVCYEEMDSGFLIATNLFVRESGGWRMVHHQAGPTRGKPAVAETEDEGPSIN